MWASRNYLPQHKGATFGNKVHPAGNSWFNLATITQTTLLKTETKLHFTDVVKSKAVSLEKLLKYEDFSPSQWQIMSLKTKTKTTHDSACLPSQPLGGWQGTVPGQHGPYSETLPQKAKTGWRDDLVFKGTCCSGGGPGLSSHTHLSSGGSDALSWPPDDCMHAMYRRQQNT